VNIELLDSRRLTGPNLYWDWPGAILDVAIGGISADQLISAWAKQAGVLMQAMGWNADNICSRIYAGGASLIINAPIDVLYTACELNEVALNRAIASLSGDTLADLESEFIRFSTQADEERNPGLLALQKAAPIRPLQRTALTGKASIQFPSVSLPVPTVNRPQSDWQHRSWPPPACARASPPRITFALAKRYSTGVIIPGRAVRAPC